MFTVLEIKTDKEWRKKKMEGKEEERKGKAGEGRKEEETGKEGMGKEEGEDEGKEGSWEERKK